MPTTIIIVQTTNLQKFNFVTAGDFGCGDDFKLKCKEGSNSPLNRPEFVDVEVSK